MEKTISDITAEQYLQNLLPKLSKTLPNFYKDITDFSKYQITKELKPNTRFNYVRVLQAYAKWLETQSITDFRNVDKDTVANYITSLMSKGLSTRNWHKIGIKVFYRWLLTPNEDKIYPPLVDWIKLKRESFKIFKKSELISFEEFNLLLDLTNNARDRCLLSLAYYGGCRVSELLNLRIKDLTIEDKKCYIRVVGKTGERVVLLIDEPIRGIRTLLRNHPFALDPNSYLFINLDKNISPNVPLAYTCAANNLKRTLAKGNVKKRIWFHLFRHTEATRFANEGYTDIEQKLRHGWSIQSSSRMHERYNHQTVEDLNKRILEKKGIETRSKKEEKELEGNEILKELIGEVKRLKKEVGVLKKK